MWDPIEAPRPRAGRVLGVSFLLLLTIPGFLRAQGGTVVGQVTSFESGEPLGGVELVVRGTDVRSITSEAGLFRLEGIPTGRQTISLSYLGAESKDVPVRVEPRQTVRVSFVVEMRVIPVAELVVTVEDQVPVSKLTGFYERMENSPGHFITRDDIDRLNPARTTAMLRRVPGLDIGKRTRGGVTPVTMSRRKGCQPQFWVDGARAPFFDVDNIQPREIAGIEVYRGNSEVPIRFKHRDRCGVIVIWTRDPGNAPSFR